MLPRRLYQISLRVLPDPFRSEHAGDLLDAFDDLRRHRGRGFRVWGPATLDVWRIAWRLRRRPGAKRQEVAMSFWNCWSSELRDAWRGMAKRPTYAVLAISTLALGMGATTTIFTLVDGVLLEPLPYPHSDRMGMLWHDFGEEGQSLPALHAADFRDYREWNQAFDAMALARGTVRILEVSERPVQVDVGVVSADFFRFFGVRPVLGRDFRDGEDVHGAPHLVILGHDLWATQFGSDAFIVGKAVQIDGRSHEIVGVLPADFRLHLPAEAFRLKHSDLWVLTQIRWDQQPPRNYTGYTGFARVRARFSFDAAQEDLDALASRLREEHPVHHNARLRARIVPLHLDVVKGAQRGLGILMAAVGLVLLIACANVAQLALIRGRARERELALRAAVGADRATLARIVLLESVLLAGLGAVLGLGVAHFGLAAVGAYAQGSVPRLESVEIDISVLLFSAAACGLSAFGFGLLPALQAARTDLSRALASGGRSGEAGRPRAFRQGLITSQLALSLVLAVGAGLLARSFIALHAARPGFVPEGVVTARITLPQPDYGEPEARFELLNRLRQELTSNPEVTDVATTSQLPLTGTGALLPYAYDDETARNWESVTADQRFISHGFFSAIGARLIAGRDFMPEEIVERRDVIIIDDLLAEIAFPGVDPVGRSLQIRPSGSDDPYAEVVGVVAHINLHHLARASLPQVFRTGIGSRASLVVRTDGDAAKLAPALQDAMRRLAPGAAVQELAPLVSIVGDSLSPQRLNLALMGTFGIVSLGLAAVGVYGLVAFSVSQRRRELGIRLAVGATPRAVRALVAGEVGRLALAGVLLGTLASGLAGRWFSGILYGVPPWDPPSHLVAIVVLSLAAIGASWMPARRAGAVDPLEALKSD